MFKGVTSSGFEYEVSLRIKKDWRFVKALAKSESKDESEMLWGTTRVVELLLGEQEEALQEHLAEEDGVVPTEKLMDTVREILNAIGTKNSSSSPE